jgi:hypothetical protein
MTFSCAHCAKKFSSKKRVLLHLIQIHPLPKAQIPCTFDGCDRVFINEGRLKLHIRSHPATPPALFTVDEIPLLIFCPQTGQPDVENKIILAPQSAAPQVATPQTVATVQSELPLSIRNKLFAIFTELNNAPQEAWQEVVSLYSPEDRTLLNWWINNRRPFINARNESMMKLQ